MRTRHASFAAATAMLLLAGCSGNQLETGYRYRPLDSTSTERTAYYAGPYSKEQLRLQSEQGDTNRRPDAFR